MSVPAIAFAAHGRPGFFYGRKVLQSVAAESPAVSFRLVNGSEDRSQGYYYMKNDATFDSNLVIILAALLCSLMCALGLSTMVRCALRCSRGGTVFESPDGVAVRLANTGLKRAAMKALPTVVYGNESRTPVVGVDCPICLAEFVEGESVKVLPQCNHGFHVDCIDTWLRSHSSCPTCRRNLLGALAKRSGAGVACGTHTSQTGDSSSEGGTRDTSAMPTSVPPSSDSTADADVEAGIVGENPGPC